MKAGRRLAWSLALLVLAAIGAIGWFFGGAKLSYSSFSPQGVYRIDSYRASWLGRWMHPDATMPGFIRLHRVDPPELLGESAVVDLNGNAEVFWMMDVDRKVSVGMDITFENIPPECGAPPCTAKPPVPPGQAGP